MREMGIRIALGAERADIILLVLQSGYVAIAVGLGTGIGLALIGSRTLSRLFSDTPVRIDAWDPLVYGGVTILLTVTAVLAMIGPGGTPKPKDGRLCANGLERPVSLSMRALRFCVHRELASGSKPADGPPARRQRFARHLSHSTGFDVLAQNSSESRLALRLVRVNFAEEPPGVFVDDAQVCVDSGVAAAGPDVVRRSERQAC
jgi:hypothetical protein